jgi:Uri superfamily endonuclease
LCLKYDGPVKAKVAKKIGPTFTPALDAWPDAGVYQLWIELRRPVKVCVGALGEIHFARGTYIYTGRASRGLRARVLRHATGAQRVRWHIDYLLAQRSARVEKVILASTNPDDECRVNGAAADSRVAVPGFGASDCRSGCPGHLWRERN